MKKILCAILSAALISVSAVPAFAAETSDKSETAVTLKEGTYAPNQVVVKFKDSAIDTDTVPKKGEVEAVGAGFGDMQAASSSEQEALGAADEEVKILKSSLGGNYTFENNLPKTCSVTYDYSDEKKTIEYNDGRVYNLHVEYEGGGFSDTWYQYANGDGFFTSLFREDHIAGTDFFPEQFAEETDSVQVTVENGLLKKTVNSGYYANWNEREPKKWLRFNGTYTAEYDSDGIAKTMSAVFRNGKDGIQYQIEVKKVNGVITEAVVKQPDGSGSLTETTKYEFEYTDAEISAARYSQMMNYFIIGDGSNYYNNNWY